MGDLLADIVEWMTSLPVLYAYLMILVVAYVENVVPPIPGDMIVVFGGYMVGVGRLDFSVVILLSTIGGAVGFMTMYVLGKRLGFAVTEERRFQWIPIKRISKSKALLGRWGYGLVLANRFLSGLRSVISLTVGMAGMPAIRTAVYATISALTWTTLLTYLGYLLGDNWEEVSVYLRTYGAIVTAIIVILIGLQVYFGFRSRRKPVDPDSAGNDGDSPISKTFAE